MVASVSSAIRAPRTCCYRIRPCRTTCGRHSSSQPGPRVQQLTANRTMNHRSIQGTRRMDVLRMQTPELQSAKPESAELLVLAPPPLPPPKRDHPHRAPEGGGVVQPARQAGMQAGRQPGSLAGRQAGRQAGSQAARQPGSPPASQAASQPARVRERSQHLIGPFGGMALAAASPSAGGGSRQMPNSERGPQMLSPWRAKPLWLAGWDPRATMSIPATLWEEYVTVLAQAHEGPNRVQSCSTNL